MNRRLFRHRLHRHVVGLRRDFGSTCTSCHQHSAQFKTKASVQASLTTIKAEISSGGVRPRVPLVRRRPVNRF